MSRKSINIIIAIIVIIIVYNLTNQIISTLKNGDRLDIAIEKLHKLEVQNRELRKRLEEVKTSEFIEQQARNKLGLVKEGETLVIIPEEKLQAVLGVTKEASELKLPNWQGWLKLFWE